MTTTRPLRALILDLFDVLVLSGNSPQRQRWLDRLGRTDEEFRVWIWQTPFALAAIRGQMAVVEFWRQVGAELGLSLEESLAMEKDYFAGDRANQEAIVLARQASGHGYLVGLLSNAYDDVRLHLRQAGIDVLFDDVVNSSEVGLMKPDPAIYRLACSRLGIRPAEALFVDDRAVNIEAARQVGLQALQYTGPASLQQAASLLGLPRPS